MIYCNIYSFPSSVAFDPISTAFASDRTELEYAIKTSVAVYYSALVNKDVKQRSWFMDLQKEGEIGKGVASLGSKLDVSIRLSDDDFASIISGKSMRGKIKVKGNFIKATKMDLILGQTKAKL